MRGGMIHFHFPTHCGRPSSSSLSAAGRPESQRCGVNQRMREPFPFIRIVILHDAPNEFPETGSVSVFPNLDCSMVGAGCSVVGATMSLISVFPTHCGAPKTARVGFDALPLAERVRSERAMP